MPKNCENVAADHVAPIKNQAFTETGLEHFSTQIVYGLYNTAQHPIAMLYHLWHTGEQGVRDYQRDNRYQRGQVWGAGLFGVGSFVASDGLLDGDVLAGEVEGSRLVVNIDRVSSNVVNKPFITEEAKTAGWDTPYPKDLTLRKITTGRVMKLYRVHSVEGLPFGRFLAREKEVAPFLNDPEALRTHLGLPDLPIYISEVNVPEGTEMYVGRIGRQENFGLMNESGFQYQILDYLPKSSFVNTRTILEAELGLGMRK